MTAVAATAMKPSIDADAVLSIDSLRAPVRSEQEQILVDLIANTPDSDVDEKCDYYFRLGELYAKQHLMWRRHPGAVAADHAKEYLLKTVKVYKALTGNEAFRNYPKLDVALFYYAYTLQGGKYMKEARQVYAKLVKDFPNSKYVAEAHLAFADYFFDAGQLADAETGYKKVLEFPKSTVYAYALYKLGWVYLKLARGRDAAEVFNKSVLATRNEPKQAALHQAARADFARTFGDWAQALGALLPADAKIVLGKPPRSRPRALPLDGNDATLVDAIKAYAAESPAADSELGPMRLALATVLRRHRQFKAAATVLDEFLEHHADDARAELAASLMLDSLMQARMLDELAEVAAAMTADTQFVDGKPQLQQNLLLVHTRLTAR